MKKITSVMMLAAAAAAAVAALVSCNKEIEKPEVPQESEGIKVVINTGAPETKTYIEGTTPKWKATDAVGVFTGAAGANVKFTNTSADGAAAVFAGTVPASGTYYAYYPYSSATPNENGQYIQIPADQHPTPTSFDGATDILISEAIEINTTDATTVNTRFRRLGSFLKFVFKDGTTGKRLSGVTATKVSVIVDNTYGDGSYRPCPSVRVKPDGLGARGEGMKTISANYGDGVFELTADGNAVYLGILPQPFATGSSFDITITAGDATIKKTVTFKKDFELTSGRILPVPITLEDADYPEKTVKIEKLWDMVSGDTANGISGSWLASLSADGKNGNAQGDRNMTMDGENVYIAEFNNSKNIWAINIETKSVKLLPTTAVLDEGLSNNYLSCARIIRNSNPAYNGGKDVLVVSNLTSGSNNRLYIYDNGIDNEPRVVEMKNCAGRLGDTFTAFGEYEKCMLTFGKHGGNGFVHFQLPVSGTSTSLQNRYNITIGGADANTVNFPALYNIPGDITKGVYAQRGEARAMWVEAATTEDKVWSEWNVKYDTPAVRLHYGLDGDSGNGFATGYNFLEFAGKRYVIYGRFPSAGSAELIIREGASTDEWKNILGLDGGVSPMPRIFYEKIITKNDSFVSGNTGLDVAVYKKSESEVYIAIDKQNVCLSVYKMSFK